MPRFLIGKSRKSQQVWSLDSASFTSTHQGDPGRCLVPGYSFQLVDMSCVSKKETNTKHGLFGPVFLHSACCAPRFPNFILEQCKLQRVKAGSK